MKKLAMVAAIGAVAIAAPAQASKPENPGSQRSAQGKSHAQKGGADGRSSKARGSARAKGKGRCTPRAVGYVAFGDYVSGQLTQTQGADTADTAHDDRWSGTLVVAVERTNRHARADKATTKTYTLIDARVQLADRDGDGTPDAAIAGDPVRLQGKITRLHRKCDASAFTADLTIRSVAFQAPEPAEGPAPAPATAP